MTTVSTINYQISVQDGWTLVATNPAYVHVRCNQNVPWYIYVSPTAPSLASVAATGSVNITGLPVADETVTVAGVIYTFKAAAGAANTVKIGADATATGDNLAAAINAGAGSGIVYGAGTVVNPYVSAVNVTGTVTVTSRVTGTGGNALTLTEAATNTTVSGAVLTGGTDASIGLLMQEFHGDSRTIYEKVGATTAGVYIRTLSSLNASFGVIRDQ